MNKLKRTDAWPFPKTEPGEEIYVNPVGNTVKNYTDEYYGNLPALNFADTFESNIFLENASTGLEFPPIEADPTGGSLNEPGKKADAGKLLPWLFLAGFANALEETAKVTTLGAKKYTPNGWASVENGPERYMEAAMRHLIYLGQGEKFDCGPGGIGTLHKAQIIWNLLASLELELREEKKT